MIYRASVQDVKEGRVSRRHCHVAVVMQYYPRFLPREKVDEYLRSLAPDRALFTEFKKRDREGHDHDGAFQEVGYESRFTLSQSGVNDLQRLSSLGRDVGLVCQCRAIERCHADLLLLLARGWFGADTQLLRHSYPVFEHRLREGDLSHPVA